MNDRAATPLVGRSDELDQMRRWLAEALAGSPRIVVMTGEPGIGKSRLVNELISDARTANVRPFAGRCLEGSRVAFLPFTTLVDTLLPDQCPAEELIARLSRSLMTSAADRALLVVVEDAQWADDPSMELLAHIAATFAHEAVFRQLPVMLLVTARSSGVPPTVQRLLTRLSREVIGRTIRLGRLDDLAVFAMLEACTGVSPSVQLLTHIQETTAGNPHEVEALLARLEHAGALQVRGRELIATVEDYSTLPGDGDAAPLLAELSDAARLLLTTLALVRDGRLTSVRIASGLANSEFDAAVDEAIDAGLLADDGVRLEFVHAATRHTLVAGLGGRRRHRSHADIARRFADAPPESHVSATEIVDQLHRARDQADSLLLTRFARVAGDECLALGAHAEALRHYEAALSLSGLRDDMRATLEERAALAAYRNTDPSAATTHAGRAIELAQRQGDLDTWGEAALLLARAASSVEPLEEFLRGAEDAAPTLRARAHAAASELAVDRLSFDVAGRHADQALQIASDTEDAATSARVEFGVGLRYFSTLDLEAAASAFSRAERDAMRADDPLTASWARGRRALVSWTVGRLRDAAALASSVADDDRANAWWIEYTFVTSIRAGIAVAQGNVAMAERLGAEAASAHRKSRKPAVAGILWSVMADARTLHGDRLAAHAALDEWERDDERPISLYRTLVDALSTDKDAPEFDARWDRALVQPDAPVNLQTVSAAALAVELADALERPNIAANAIDVLRAAETRGVRFTPGWCFFVPRLVGVAHLLVSNLDAATVALKHAIDEAQRAGAAGEAARSRYDLARVQLAEGGRGYGEALLDSAIDECDRLGFGPLLRSARRLAGRPDSEGMDDDTTRVIVVTDLVASTPLAQRLGDRRYVELLRQHNEIVRGRLRQFDGVEFKHTGDGIAAWFLNARAAVECCLRIQMDIREAIRRVPDLPLLVRVGVSAGTVVADEGDVFGLAVNKAFRVCDYATDGRVLVSSDVPPLVREGVHFTAARDVKLKGFSETETVYEATTADT